MPFTMGRAEAAVAPIDGRRQTGGRGPGSTRTIGG